MNTRSLTASIFVIAVFAMAAMASATGENRVLAALAIAFATPLCPSAVRPERSILWRKDVKGRLNLAM
jgi:hypothetical protein